MKDSRRRLIRLEKLINGNESGGIIIMLGDETFTFKSKKELVETWIAAALLDNLEERNDKQSIREP